MFGLITRRRHNADLAALRSQYEALRERCELAESREATERAARRTITRQFTDADEARTALTIVNACLTDDLTKVRARLAEYGSRRTVPEVLEEHDVHRKALADALGDQMRHNNWDQLIADVARLHKAASAWMADYEAEKRRADRLQKQYDDACGLNTAAVLDGERWQQRRTDGGTKAVTS